MAQRKREDIQNFKIESKVFDDRTLLNIYKLMAKGVLNSVESFVKEGKESVVLSGKDKKGKWLAIKVYKVEHCDFRNMWMYLVGDPRFSRVKKGRRSVVYNWCKREFRNLKIAYANNISCPKPIAFRENVLVIEFIGKNGVLAPRLFDVTLRPTDAQLIYDFIINDVKKLFDAGLVHADLSPYNILLYEKPYIIDFSQAVPVKHQLAQDLLRNDLRNLNTYFKKFGVTTVEVLK